MQLQFPKLILKMFAISKLWQNIVVTNIEPHITFFSFSRLITTTSQKELVAVGRWITAGTMVLGVGLGLLLTDATQAFNLLLLLGAGTGLIYILRWFWWRINAYSEIVAMFFSFFLAIYLQLIHPKLEIGELSNAAQLLIGIFLTTTVWVGATLATRPTSRETLFDFYRLVRPGGPGWSKVVKEMQENGEEMPDASEGWQLPLEILGMVIGCFTVYSVLFATGFWLYGQLTSALILSVVALLGGWGLFTIWNKLNAD